VTLVCVTDGEGGSRELIAGQALSRIRRQELMLSASVLGVSEVLYLGYADIAAPDGGGEGSWDQPKLIAALAQIFEKNDPKLVLTHGPLGGYGNAAHRLVHRCVMSAARVVPFSGSIFSFCGQVRHAFFSWHFDQRSDVFIDASRFLGRRVASLSYHQSQISFFLQPYFPRTLRKYLSASFGFVFILSEAGRKRVPIGTPTRFFKKFPVEGLALQKVANIGQTHFFLEHFANEKRVQFNR
jgi:LmbE family N-acetylglucosaminyl deacetylase